MTLPEFKVVIAENDSTITLNGRKVASAWGPAADGTGEWFAYRYGENPERFPTEYDARSHCASVVNMPLPDWATKAQAPVVGDDGEPCCGHHGHICEVSDEGDGCCGRCPVWATS